MHSLVPCAACCEKLLWRAHCRPDPHAKTPTLWSTLNRRGLRRLCKVGLTGSPCAGSERCADAQAWEDAMAAIASRLKYTPEPQALPKVTCSPFKCC